MRFGLFKKKLGPPIKGFFSSFKVYYQMIPAGHFFTGHFVYRLSFSYNDVGSWQPTRGYGKRAVYTLINIYMDILVTIKYV